MEPITPVTFDAIALSPETRRGIDALGYLSPTPVQVAVFEPAAAGKSIVVQARTGTGKTIAFGLPILDRLVRPADVRPQALILTPTRELAIQVSAELEAVAKFRPIKITTIYGGASMEKQVAALTAGVHVVVGTPGRVLDHLRRGTFDASGIRIFVLDEADEMLSMGFAKELHAIVEKLPKERQGLFFSATVPPDIEDMARRQLGEPEFITLSSDQVGALELSHSTYFVTGDKRQALARVLEIENPESAVIFCNTKDETERVAEFLSKLGFVAEWLNGDLAQGERERVMTKIREGKLRFLVATDIASRGIDISHLTHVINHDFPDSAEAYVHRTGRTGRAGRTGHAVSLIAPRDIGHVYQLRLTYKIRPIEKSLPSTRELETRSELDILGVVAERFGALGDRAPDLALARRLLAHDDAERLIAGILRTLLGTDTKEPKKEAEEARRGRLPTPAEKPRDSMIEELRPARDTSGSSEIRFSESQASPGRSAESRASSPRDRRPRDAGSRDTGSRDTGPRDIAPNDRRDRAPRAEPRPARNDEPRTAGAGPHRAESGRGDAGRSDAGRSDAGRNEKGSAVPAGGRLFLNVGRREGLRPGEIIDWLTAAGIDRTNVGAIRIRDNMTLVALPLEDVERAAAAISGKEVQGKAIVAEAARVTETTSSSTATKASPVEAREEGSQDPRIEIS